MNYYKLLEMSYINGALHPEGKVVQINDDPDNGGMEPGANMVPCDEQGNVTGEVKPVKAKAKPGAKPKKAESADDLA